MFNNAAAAHPSDVSAFLGSPSTGGFLKAATDTLNGLEDPTTGTIQTTLASAQTAIDNQNQKISDAQDRLDALTTSLTAKIIRGGRLDRFSGAASQLLHHPLSRA